MGIIFFNNWRDNDQFIVVEASWDTDTLVFALLGFGIAVSF